MGKSEDQYLALIEKGGPAVEVEVRKIFDNLKPVEPEFLLGQWFGNEIDTGHPVHQALVDINWVGKDFHSVNNVDPIMVHGADKTRVKCDTWGQAQLRKVEFNGVVSAAMIYDNHPIIDHFRYVNDNTVAGVMDSRDFRDNQSGHFHFFLQRINQPSS